MVSKVIIDNLPGVSNALWKKILVNNLPDVQQTIIIIIIIQKGEKSKTAVHCVLTMICLVKIRTWIERKFQKNSRLNDIDMDDAIILEEYL